MGNKDNTCASCIHCSIDGRFCHNWHRPTETGYACPQHPRIQSKARGKRE